MRSFSLLLLVLLVFPRGLLAAGFAPDSIAGKSFVVVVTSGTYPWASIGGARVTLSGSDKSCVLTALTNTVDNDTGTYTYQKLSNDTGKVTMYSASMKVYVDYNLVFTSATTANYSINALGGKQTGLAIWENVTQQVIGDRLTNMSVRAVVPKDGKIVPGFVLEKASTVLVRVGGPALAGFGVQGTLANPKMDLYQGNTKLASNDDWCGTTANQNAVVDAQAKTGAFNYVSGSKDAALVLSLDPGAYSAEITGDVGTTGEVILEVYRLP